MTINLRAKLSAYTKNALLQQAPQDDKIYGRKNDQWVEIKNSIVDITLNRQNNEIVGFTETYADGTGHSEAWSSGDEIPTVNGVQQKINSATTPINNKLNTAIKNVSLTIVDDVPPSQIIGDNHYNFVTAINVQTIQGVKTSLPVEKLVPKEYVDKECVLSTPLPWKIYGTGETGGETVQAIFNIDSYGSDAINIKNGNIVHRVSGAQIYVPQIPSEEQHATSKKYVDDKLNEKLSIPRLPTSDGEYVLKCKITNGVVSYSWEATE